MARRPLTVPFEPTRHLREDPWAIKLALDVIEFDFGVFTKVSESRVYCWHLCLVHGSLSDSTGRLPVSTFLAAGPCRMLRMASSLWGGQRFRMLSCGSMQRWPLRFP